MFESFDFIVVISTAYIALLAIAAVVYLLRRERRKAADSFAPEATRWIENADSIHTLGWTEPALITAYVGMEHMLRGIARQIRLPEAEMPLRHLAQRLNEDRVISDSDLMLIEDATEIRNRIVHGRSAEIDKENIVLAYDNCVKLTNNLLADKTRKRLIPRDG